MATSPTFSTNNQFIKYRIVVTETAQSIENNTTSINVKVQAWRTNTGYTTDDDGACYCNIDGTKYSNSWSYGQKPITHNSYTTLFNKDLTITHDADGTKQIYVSAYIKHDRFSSNSQGFNVTLTTIPRQATIINAQDFTDEANPVLTYSNPAGSVVDSLQACISVDNSTPTIAYRDIDKLGASYTFELTTAERNTLLQATPNSNTLNVYFIIKTVIAGVTYYSSALRVMTVANGKPTVTGASYQDTNASTLAITGDSTKLIQAHSTAQFNFTSITAVKYATLVSVAVTVNAVSVSKALSGSTASNESLTFGTINSAENLEAIITITDSRGNQGTATLSLTMYAWSLPTANISLKRKANYYAETYLKVTSVISSLGGNNAVTIQYQYKETTASTYGALTTIQDDTEVTINVDNTKAFDFKIIVSDLLGSTTYNTVLQVGLPILFIDRLLRSVGIGAIPPQTNMLAVDRRLALYNTLQKLVADLWATSTTGGTYSAFLRFYNENSDITTELSGYNGGYLKFKHSNGNAGVDLRAGNFELCNDSGTTVIWGFINPNNDSGVINICDSNGDTKLRLWVGGNNDGVIDVLDSQGNTTVSIAGETGLITCKNVKQSAGTVEVVDTAFNTGNKTFNDNDYQTITVIAKVTSTSSYNIINIPVMFLESTDKKFCISDEQNYVTFYLKLDNGVYTITWNTANSSGSIEKVYANY